MMTHNHRKKHTKLKLKARKHSRRQRQNPRKTHRSTFRHKWRRRSRKQQGGNTINFIYCESEGCAIYPSPIKNDVIPNLERVLKLYKTTKFYKNEFQKYREVDAVDPIYQYHPQIYNAAEATLLMTPEFLNSAQIPPKMQRSLLRIFPENSVVPYIDMQYAGQQITTIEYSSPEQVIQTLYNFLEFIRHILTLQNAQGELLIHADLHGGNVCVNTQGQIRMIDLTNVQFISSQTILHIDANFRYAITSIEQAIVNQFSSIKGIIMNFAYKLHSIADIQEKLFAKSAVLMRPFEQNREISYSDLLKEMLEIYKNMLE